MGIFYLNSLGDKGMSQEVTFERGIYLGVAKIFGLKNKEYLMENLQGLKVGD